MKLYDDKLAPNPRRVRIFLAEKGIEVPTEQVSIMKGEHKAPEFRKKSPLAQLPALELDDGGPLTESVAICRYFEESQPEPPLMGRTPREKAMIEMWQRRIEFLLLFPIAAYFRHTHKAMAQLETQHKGWGELNLERANKFMQWLDRDLKGREHIAGDDFSVVDITALCSLDFGAFFGVGIPGDCKALTAWHERVSARPSAKA